MAILSRGAINTFANNTFSNLGGAAGDIVVDTHDLLIDGDHSQISSANSGTSGGAAGAISIHSGPATLSNGGAITTDSATGQAGSISMVFDHGGLLILEGERFLGEITTTSATATAGRDHHRRPHRDRVLNDGRIQALGPFQGAFVTVSGGPIVEFRRTGAAASRRPEPWFSTARFVDVGQAVTQSSASFEDASKVLSGQCPALRARRDQPVGVEVRHGPYGPTATGGAKAPRSAATARRTMRVRGTLPRLSDENGGAAHEMGLGALGAGRRSDPDQRGAGAGGAPAAGGRRTHRSQRPAAAATPVRGARADVSAAASAPAPPPGLEFGEMVLFSDVRIDQGGRRFPARAARAVIAGGIPGGELAVSHGRGEFLDADWVRRQFIDNHLIGVEISADRVVALILLINRAYVNNGYINSGLLLSPQGWPARGAVLRLQLVAGRVVPSAPGAPAVAVTWKDNQIAGAHHRLHPPAHARRLALAARRRQGGTGVPAAGGRSRHPHDQHGAFCSDRAPARRRWRSSSIPSRDMISISFARQRPLTLGRRGAEAAIGGSMRNALIAGDVLGGELGVTSGLTDGSAYYSMPVGGPISTLDARVAFDNAAVVDESLRALNIRSRESSFAIGASATLIDTPLTPNPSGLGWIPARSLDPGLTTSNTATPTAPCWASTVLALAGLGQWPLGARCVAGLGRFRRARRAAGDRRPRRRRARGCSAPLATSLALWRRNPNFFRHPRSAQLCPAPGRRRLSNCARALAGQWASGPPQLDGTVFCGRPGHRAARLSGKLGYWLDIGAPWRRSSLSCPVGIGHRLCNANTEGLEGRQDRRCSRMARSLRTEWRQATLAQADRERGREACGLVAGQHIPRPSDVRQGAEAGFIGGPPDLQDRGFEFQLILYPIPACSPAVAPSIGPRPKPSPLPAAAGSSDPGWSSPRARPAPERRPRVSGRGA